MVKIQITSFSEKQIKSNDKGGEERSQEMTDEWRKGREEMNFAPDHEHCQEGADDDGQEEADGQLGSRWWNGFYANFQRRINESAEVDCRKLQTETILVKGRGTKEKQY